MESTILQNAVLKRAATTLVAGLETVGLGLLVLTAMSCSDARAERQEKQRELHIEHWENRAYDIECKEKLPGTCKMLADSLREIDGYRQIIREYEEQRKEMIRGEMSRNIREPASRI